MKIIYIAGTGTEVGKTFIATRLAISIRKQGVRVGVYKPVASGCIRQESDSDPNSTHLVSSDALAIWEAAGKPLDLDAVCPQRFEAAVAPDEAARREQTVVNVETLLGGVDRWREHCDTLIVEGAGGLFSPIADELLNIDLYRKLEQPTLFLVAPNRLGVIHEVIATCRAAEQLNVAPARLFLSANCSDSDPSCGSNADQIRKWLPELNVQEVLWNGDVETGDL